MIGDREKKERGMGLLEGRSAERPSGALGVCEYTVHKPMAGTAYVWGYLAARPKQATRSIDSERE